MCVFMFVLYVRETRGVHEQTSSPPPCYLPDPPSPPPGATDIKGSVLPYSLGERTKQGDGRMSHRISGLFKCILLKKKNSEGKKGRGLSDIEG